jgi:GH43 family beta-xylosidase
MTKKQPLVTQRADPFVYHHTDGYYYFTGSVPGYQEIEIRRAKTLAGLQDGQCLSVWHAHDKGVMSQLIWAPEIHYIAGAWYIYFAAADDATQRNAQHHHRMFVLRNENADPMNQQWTEMGQVQTPQDSFSLDATVFEHRQQWYYVWAQLTPATRTSSDLYIARLANPWTLATAPIMLSMPEFTWEKSIYPVNEGPAVIEHGDKVFLTYSANATDEHYAMGLLWADGTSDLLNAYSWHKQEAPVFVSSKRYDCMALDIIVLPPVQMAVRIS